MVDLIARSPCADLLPREIGTLTLTEVDPGPVTSIAPFKGQAGKVSSALKDALGLGLPQPNRMLAKRPARTIWTGLDQAMLTGVSCPDLSGAALTDQSDAHAVVSLSGEGAEAVLARLTPLDLRPAHFKRGHVARTLIGHMTGTVIRTGAASFELWVFRSMAGTLVHELERAMQFEAARA